MWSTRVWDIVRVWKHQQHAGITPGTDLCVFDESFQARPDVEREECQRGVADEKRTELDVAHELFRV